MYQSSKTQTQPRQPISADQAKKAAISKGKSFCKVCFDAGKPESSYTSHYLKSSPGPDGKLVCPTLLNQSCLTCGQRGHTSSYCAQRNETAQTQGNRTSQTTRTFEKKAHDRFDTFDTDEIQVQVQVPKQEVPSHRYNPRSNAFGALEKKPEPEPNPMTMAERLTQRLTQRLSQTHKTHKTHNTQMLSQAPMPIPEFGTKSQFWWQDLDD